MDGKRGAAHPVERAGSAGAKEGIWMTSDSPHCCVYSGARFPLFCARLPVLAPVSLARFPLVFVGNSCTACCTEHDGRASCR
jgi:hypothetical protein